MLASSQYNLVSIYTYFFNLLVYLLDDQITGTRFLKEAKHFSLFHSIQTSPGAGRGLYPLVAGWFLPWGRIGGIQVDLQLLLRLRMHEVYFHSPIQAHDMVLS